MHGDEDMDERLYIMLIERGENYNRVNMKTVRKHVDNIRSMDDDGRLVLCGPTKDYPGVAGMIIFRAKDKKEAVRICRSEPFVAEGYATYKLVSMRPGTRENNYLL